MIRRLDRTEWGEFICDEMQAVLSLLEKEHGIRVTQVILDIKGVYVDVYVDRPLNEIGLSPNALAGVRVGDDSISCPEHFCSIQHSAAMRDRTLMDRVRSLFN